jgi:hypothetical protein
MPIVEKNPGAMRRLRMRAAFVGSNGFKAQLHQVLAAAALKENADCFVGQRSPYGEPFKALTSRDGQALRNTGAMMASAHTNQRSNGFVLVLDRGHPVTHNRGATIVPVAAAALRFMVRGAVVFAQKVVIPKRQIVPDRQRGLGLWGPTFRKDAADLLRRSFGRAT